MFDLYIVSPYRILFDDAVESVRVDGDESEYEFLDFHQKCFGLLRKGDIIINNKFKISIKQGLVKFADNKCHILIEEDRAQRTGSKHKGKGS